MGEDDILGTPCSLCRSNGDECFIATGDRDSLQLAHDGVKVLLARTKMGQAVTDVYDEAVIMEENGITPQRSFRLRRCRAIQAIISPRCRRGRKNRA
jgi:DNA polymerase-1